VSRSKSENILNKVVLDRGKFHRFHANIYVCVCVCVHVHTRVHARALTHCVCMCAQCVYVHMWCVFVRMCVCTLGFFIVRHE